MKLTDNFTLEELTFSEQASRRGLDNTPSEHQTQKLLWLAHWLEQVRLITGPLHVNSAHRSALVNSAVGGQPNSQHMADEAADVVSVSGVLTPYQLCEKVLDSDLKFDQLIYEFRAWMHISFAPIGRAPRQSVLTITSLGTQRGLHP